jgi:hypothetical protein
MKRDCLEAPDEDPFHESRASDNSVQSAETAPGSVEAEAELERIKDLPKEVGVLLMTVGVLGFALPGIVGAPAVIAGGLVLWPKAFGKAESWFERQCPRFHRKSLSQINRFLNDLESRYPNSGP